MLNFTVGPVQSPDCVKEIGACDTPYFRTPEFSSIMLDNESLVNKCMMAPEGSRVVFVTGSGTAAMETVVMGTLSEDDKAIVVNGGSFGNRFCELCELHNIKYTPINLSRCEALRPEMLEQFDGQGYTAFIVNIHETSTGILYDAELISDFCRRNGLFLIVDAISSFLADPFDMEALGANVVITGSQKALACPPGVSLICLDPEALKRIERIPAKCMYLDLSLLLKNGERGQTPFTPAVTTLLQINARLHELVDQGGVEAEIQRIGTLADDFRQRIKHLPIVADLTSPSNAVTFIHTPNCSAKQIFQTLKDEYGIWICPNGGEHADDSFRVGHIGYLTPEDNAKLVDAFDDLVRRGIIA